MEKIYRIVERSGGSARIDMGKASVGYLEPCGGWFGATIYLASKKSMKPTDISGRTRDDLDKKIEAFFRQWQKDIGWQK